MGSTELASLGLHLPRRVPVRLYLYAVFFAAIGGVFGILGAAVQELQTGGFLLLPFLGAPIIEEAMKPSGLYLVLVRWPEALSSRFFTAVLAGLGGLIFGVIEALVYVNVYVSDPPDWFVTYRFTLPLIMHTAASFVFGLGISVGIIDWATGRGKLPKRTRNFYVAAVAMHAIFNTVAVGLAIAGVFDV